MYEVLRVVLYAKHVYKHRTMLIKSLGTAKELRMYINVKTLLKNTLFLSVSKGSIFRTRKSQAILRTPVSIEAH